MKTIDNTTTEIILGGSLGEAYGRSHHLVAKTPIEALRLLWMNYPQMKADMVAAADSGSEFQFIIDESRGLTAEQLALPIGGQRMLLTEAVMGEKGGAFGIIEAVVGVILIAAAEIWSFGSATPFIIGLGGSLIVGGITSLLTTLPTQTGAAGDTLSSFYFNGPANTQQQGLPVPVVYGRALIGSTAISASMQAVDLASAPAETGDLS